MNSQRKRMANLRESRLRSRSRSETPGPSYESQRPSAARRALMMGLALEGPEPHVECKSPPKNLVTKALQVHQTPRGTLNIVGDANIISTPGGSTRVERLPLRSDVVEIVESLDLDDEEAADVMREAPWHVKRWFQDLPDQDDTEAGPSRPRQEPLQTERRKEDPGSEFDSDFDDQFDGINIGSAVPIQGRVERDIPNDEELEEPVRIMVEATAQAMDDEADRLLLGVSNSYDWKEDFDSFKGVPESFSGPTPGPIRDYDTPYEAFTDIFSTDLIELITRETNRYAKQEIDKIKAKGTLKPLSRLHEWVDTTEDEIMVLLAVFMYMGIDPRTSQNEYWRSNDYLEMPKFKSLMPFNRYILLNKFLHFVENKNGQASLPSEETLSSPKLKKIEPILTHLGAKFSSLYNLGVNISIDESLTLYKGRLSWAQTIRSKSARFGIKSYELCESGTGYMYKFQIYTGKNSCASSVIAPSVDLAGKSTQVVLELLQGLENLGHCVTMDNFYNCPALTRYLKSLHFDCLGTLRANRRNVPEAINKIPKNVAKDTIIARHCGDVSIIAWKDSKVVTMISSYHNSETYAGSKAGKPCVKPVCVRDYNKTMGGVDLKDQKLSMYLLERKRCVKWYMKIFKRLLNVSIHNAFVMHSASLRRRDKLPMTHREFRYELAKSLAEHHCPQQPETSEPLGEFMRLRRDVLHEPNFERGGPNRRRCVVCLKQNIRKMVNTQCVTCGGKFMCFGNCWRERHTLKVLKGQERGRKRRRISVSD